MFRKFFCFARRSEADAGRKRWAGFKNPQVDFSQNEFGFRQINTTIVLESLF
jgi:hypothetical protein